MSEFRDQLYRPATYSAVKSWRERRGRYRLEGSRCAECDALFFPRRVSCRNCHGRKLTPYECSHTGTLVVSWPQVHLARLLGHADLPRRFVGVVRLDDGIHIETELIQVTRETAKPGLRLEMVVRKLRRESNGNQVYGYKFRPSATVEESSEEDTEPEASDG